MKLDQKKSERLLQLIAVSTALIALLTAVATKDVILTIVAMGLLLGLIILITASALLECQTGLLKHFIDLLGFQKTLAQGYQKLSQSAVNQEATALSQLPEKSEDTKHTETGRIF